MLYQGEDVTIKLTGDELVDFVTNDFMVLIYPYDRSNTSGVEVRKSSCTRVDGENSYLIPLSHTITNDMAGMYSIEVMLVTSENKRSIYKQDNAFTVESSRIKDSYGISINT